MLHATWKKDEDCWGVIHLKYGGQGSLGPGEKSRHYTSQDTPETPTKGKNTQRAAEPGGEQSARDKRWVIKEEALERAEV